MLMKFSFIIATYNRKNDLLTLLDSISGLDYPMDFIEVIIVDDGSSDGTKAAIDDTIRASDIPIRYEYQQNQGPGVARSRGMEMASGDMFIFIDTDCTVPPGYIRSIVDEYEAAPFDAFGGPDSADIDFSAWDKAVSFTLTSFLTTGGLRGSAGKKLARYYPRSFNMGLKRQVYEKIGGFGSIFQYGEDIEYSHRILQSGAVVRFLPAAVVYHKRRSSPGAFVRQIFRMGRARIQLWRIDRALLEPLHTIPLLAMTAGLALLFTALAMGGMALVVFLLIFICGCLIIGGIGAIKNRAASSLLLVPFAFILQTFAYGSGMLAELVTGSAEP
jgi:GT2 family glycosyltransferase